MVALVGLLWRRQSPSARQWAVQALLCYIYPAAVLLVLAYSTIVTGNVFDVSRTHLFHHAEGFDDSTCAMALGIYGMHSLMDAPLYQTSWQLLVSLAFFLVVSIGHSKEWYILSVACLHAVLLILRTASGTIDRSWEHARLVSNIANNVVGKRDWKEV